jgi:hypothetical protein
LKPKVATITYSTILILAMAISLFPLSTVNAQVDRVTYAYIGATPNPVGVGQETLLHIGIMQQLSSTRQSWEGLWVSVKHPDGTTEKLDNDGKGFTTDSTGGTGYSFVPPGEGEYILQTHFPAQVCTSSKLAVGSAVGDTMLESVSPELTLVVTAEQQPVYQEHPLPTEFWTRPIDSQLRGWSAISGSQLEAGGYGGDVLTGNAYAPETAHILWKHPLQLGGLAGGDLGGAGTYTGDAYEGKFSSSLMIEGILIYRKFDTIGGSDVANWIVAVDVHTGEKLWEKELFAYGNSSEARVYPSFAQIFYWDSFNAHGTHPYLVCSSGGGGFFAPAPTAWHFFDPLTARYLFTWEDAPSGTRNRGPHGEIIVYEVDLSAGTIRMWNSSAVTDAYWGGTTPDSPTWGSWRPQGKITNCTGPCTVTFATPLGLNGYQWEETIKGSVSGTIVDYKVDDRLVGYNWSYTSSSMFGGTMGVTAITVWGISLEPGNVGKVLFQKTWNAPSSWAADVSISQQDVSIEDGLMTFWAKELTHHVGFSTETGDKIWGPTESQNYLDYLGQRTVIGEGRYFSLGMSGILHCYNATTGDLMWTYRADDPYNQVLWSNQWHIRLLFIADGKIYAGTTEHSPVDPLTRGAPFCAVDIETGEEVFRADGLFRQTDWGGRAIMGDSIIATMDTYDLQVYGIGKGPSAITVEAPDSAQAFGAQILVKGMVTDVSPGTKEYASTARFPNGVPAVSDANMSQWMLYVHKQFERPADIVGVEVTISVFDPNGNVYSVGTATSDATGLYSCAFVPEVPGTYTVIAAFDGSGAYYGSSAETAITVEEAQESTPPPTEPPASVADMYMLPSTIGIIVAIAVVGLLLFTMIRKR